MPSTRHEGAKLGLAMCSSTHVAIDMSLEKNTGSLPLASQRNLPAARCRQWNRSRARNKSGGDIHKNSFQSRFRDSEALTSWAMKSGWWTEARSIEEKKWMQACGMQKQQLVGALGLLWKRVDEITSLDNEALALALQSQVSFTNVKWDELKVHDAVICISYISSGKHFFKPTLPEKPAGTVGGSESEIAGSLVRDFWTAKE